MADKRRKHGLRGMMAAISTRGLTAIDGRSAGARALLEWKKELIADLGGEANLTAQRRTLVELATRHRLYLDEIDQWLMSQNSVVVKRRRSPLPIFSTRMQLSEALMRILTTLGLERAEPPAPDLKAFVAAHDAEKEAAQQEGQEQPE
jgi:hypothetical protein